jgi:Fe-S oxidoreductase
MGGVVMQPGYFPANIIFSLVFLAAIGFFCFTVYKLYCVLRLGQPENRFDQIGKRLWSVATFVFGQKRVVREPSGWGHFFIFWGFIIITIGSLETFGVGFYHGFAYWKILGKTLTAFLYLLQDLLCTGVVGALIVSLYRRFVIKPERLRFTDRQAANKDAGIIIGLILVLVMCLFGVRGVEYCLAQLEPGRYFPSAAFVSVAVSGLFAGMSQAGLAVWYSIFWWLHTLIILGFLVYVPFSKHLHILGAIPNIFFRRFRPIGELSKMDLEDESKEKFGVSEIEEFSWKQLLDLCACTECGRCSENCPAALTGKPLSPKETTHCLKKHLLAKGKLLVDKKDEPEGCAAEELKKALIGEICLPDEIWSCTTCGNCMEHCPVFGEHIQKIIDMRRYLVLTESNFPPEVQNVMRNWETNSNPWGLPFATRDDWAKDLDVKTLAENPEAEYLLYVGCAGSFDARAKKVTAAVVKLLNYAGINFAILGTEEKCCGETARRIGNEYLFQTMATELTEIINGYGIKKIITTCPHCYNTLKNEYYQFGGNWEVFHHSEFLHRLLNEGKLKPRCRLDHMDTQVVFHDSCYLGRYNGLYEEPREILKAIPGLCLEEMERCRNKSFCCGAGGGRMWMEETLGHQKINEARTDQALAQDPEIIGVCCPFCAIMLEDGIKARNKEETVKVLDIAELLLLSVEAEE